MPAPNAVASQMEGLVGSMATTGAKQRVADWVTLAKAVMRLPGNREYTDWAFKAVNDITSVGVAIESSAGTFYGCLLGYNAATAGGDHVVISNATSNTFDGTAVLDNGDFIVINLPAAATEDTEEFHSALFPEGVTMGTGITVAAEAVAGGAAPATDDIRGWFLYRTT